MGKLIKVDFGQKSKDLYWMKKQLKEERKYPLSDIQKIEEIFKKQAVGK